MPEPSFAAALLPANLSRAGRVFVPCLVCPASILQCGGRACGYGTAEGAEFSCLFFSSRCNVVAGALRPPSRQSSTGTGMVARSRTVLTSSSSSFQNVSLTDGVSNGQRRLLLVSAVGYVTPSTLQRCSDTFFSKADLHRWGSRGWSAQLFGVGPATQSHDSGELQFSVWRQESPERVLTSCSFSWDHSERHGARAAAGRA
jgi:hypothetical protein